MLAPSKMRFGLPEVLSTIAGMRPFAVKKVSLVTVYLNQTELNASVSDPPSIWRGGNVSLTIDLEEPWLLLLVLAKLELVHVVLKAQLLQRDGDLVSIEC